MGISQHNDFFPFKKQDSSNYLLQHQLMSKYYFYTDINQVSAQTNANDGFGSVLGAESTQYQTASKHQSLGGVYPKAYAVCEGEVFVQQNSISSELVTVVLKPAFQSVLHFSTISYFIYRGIRKDSLFNGSEIASENTNQLTKHIWTTQRQFDDTVNPSADLLGITMTASASSPNTLADNEPLDRAFSPGGTYQWFRVKAGWHIANFDSEFSFEIVLDEPSFTPNVGFIRQQGTQATSSILTVSALPSNPTQADIFTHIHEKQAALSFIDPCAFYGILTYDGVYAKKQANDTSFTLLDAQSIYDDLLSIYFTKDLIYLDIRNEHGFSLNYYQNYTSGPSGSYTADIEIDYTGTYQVIPYENGGDWPILPIDTSSIANYGNPFGLFSLRLPIGDNDSPVVYLGQGYFSTDAPKITSRLVSYAGGTGSKPVIDLAVPMHPVTGEALPGYIHLRYLKSISQSSPTPSPLTLPAQSPFDNLFDLSGLLDNANNPKIAIEGNHQVKWHTLSKDVYADFYDDYNPNPFMGNPAVAEDDDGIYFVCMNNGEDIQHTGVSLSLQSGHVAGTNFLRDVLERKYSTIKVLRSSIPTANGDRDYLQFLPSYSGPITTKTKAIPENLVLICIDKQTDWPIIQTKLAEFGGGFHKFLMLRNETQSQDSLFNTYWEAELYAVGHHLDSSTNTVVRRESATGIKLYYRDGQRQLATENYAQLIQPVGRLERNRKELILVTALGVYTSIRALPDSGEDKERIAILDPTFPTL
jgi:hypothetical protein